MNIIIGGTGHVGSALASILLADGEEVTIVCRDKTRARRWTEKGAQVRALDIRDVSALHLAFNQGKRLFLLNPPAPPSTDSAAEERKSLASIFDAIHGTSLTRIVALSTYGAQAGNRIGDMGVLYDMEKRLTETTIPSVVIRAAYFMSNWEMSLQTAVSEGTIYSFFPPAFKFPMVSPKDIGRLAAHFFWISNLLREFIISKGRSITQPKTWLPRSKWL